MKGLLNIPTQGDLQRSYALLQSRRAVDEGQFAKLSQWIRFDPRLGEIWLTRFLKDWPLLRPRALREAILNEPWPTALGVMIEQAIAYGDLCLDDRHMLRILSQAILAKVPLASHENFFIGLTPLASKSLKKDAAEPLNCFIRWGYFGREIFLNKASDRLSRRPPKTELSARRRRLKLNELLKLKNRITVKDYRYFLEDMVSIRTAQNDLNSHPKLQAYGRTQSRFYRLKTRTKPTP